MVFFLIFNQFELNNSEFQFSCKNTFKHECMNENSSKLSGSSSHKLIGFIHKWRQKIFIGFTIIRESTCDLGAIQISVLIHLFSKILTYFFKYFQKKIPFAHFWLGGIFQNDPQHKNRNNA